MTDPTGTCFLSYRRSRIDEAKMLIPSLRENGIPTWQDTTDLAHEPTEQELSRVLQDEKTAGALLWITPDVPGSSIMSKVEIPAILLRHRENDGFFLVPVAAGGLGYADAAKAAASDLTADDLSYWNVLKVDADPITEHDAATVARRVLRQRLVAIHRFLPEGQPLPVALFTRAAPPKTLGAAVALNWAHCFHNRVASDASWKNKLLPALVAVAEEIRAQSPGRSIEAFGQPALPAAVALGAAFPTTSGLQLGWRQESVGRPSQLWDHNKGSEKTPLVASVRPLHADGAELAVLVSVTGNAEPAFAASREQLPKFRAVVSVQSEKAAPYDVRSAGEANDIALKTNVAIREARAKYGACNAIHLFLAVPAGLAVLIGRLLNSLGPIQLYEHMPQDTVGRYIPAVRLNPSL